jgi:L-ribulose-5-phosphate 4-epimerase
VVIKPSGVDYDGMKPDDMVVLDLKTGSVVEGRYRPSSDTETHLVLYRAFPSIGGITHTHSIHAVAFAQAGLDIPALGTTHADYFFGAIPCTRELTQHEVEEAYERNTGKVIVDCFRERNLDPGAVPGVVVKNHGPFSWGKDAMASVYHAVVMEVVSDMAIQTLALNPQASMAQYVLDKHYMRKHGPNAYYGQEKK